MATDRQQDVLEVIVQQPGATIQNVADRLGVSHTSATYHLRALEKKGLIHRTRHGRTVRHFAAGHDRRGEHRLAPLMRDEKRARVLSHLQEEDPRGASINKLATRLGLTFGVMKSTLEELQELGMIEVERVHGRYRVHVRNSLRRFLGDDSPSDRSPGVERFTDRRLARDDLVRAWRMP